MSIKCWLLLSLIYFSLAAMGSAAWSMFFHVDLVPPNWGIPASELQRQRRQVVTPEWLRGPVQWPNSQSSVVRVTPQNLRETAAIRASIQKAVNEGTYVIATDPQQIALAQLGYGNQWPLLGQTGPTMLPTFRLANLWPNLSQRPRQLQPPPPSPQPQGKAN